MRIDPPQVHTKFYNYSLCTIDDIFNSNEKLNGRSGTFLWPLWSGNFAKKSSSPPSCYDNDKRSGAASQAASVASEVCAADIPAVVAENGNVIDELGGDEVKQRRVSIASIDRARA